MPECGPIDAVVTWVDGNDPELRKKRDRFLDHGNSGPERGKELAAGKHRSRFIDNGEIRWCLSSIRKFAPWIRTIHLITDKQRPGFLTPSICAELNIRIVDHSELFTGYEWALPTFNNRTIETALWRIEGLSEQFIYLNDDFVILQSVQPEDFFLEHSVVCRGHWKRIKKRGFWFWKINQLYNSSLMKFWGIPRTMHNVQQMVSAEIAGCTKVYYQMAHVPHPLKRSTLLNFFKANEALFKKNIRHRFRSVDQFSAVFLAYHLEIQNQSAILESSSDAAMVRRRIFPSGSTHFLSAIGNSSLKFLCLQNLESLNPSLRQQIESRLNQLINGEA
jgi:hypothetical protein